MVESLSNCIADIGVFIIGDIGVFFIVDYDMGYIVRRMIPRGKPLRLMGIGFRQSNK